MIITLHRICDKLPLTFDANLGLYTSTETLINFILYAKKLDKKFISLNQYIKKSNKKDYITITFDDGYLDNYELAYPILKDFNIPFTIFITTDFIVNNNFPWWFLLEDFLVKKSLNNKKISKKYLELFTIISKNHRLNREFLNIRKRILHNKFDIKILDTYKKFTSKRLGKRIFMNWEELEFINNDYLFTLGCHTVSHKRLSNCSFKESNYEINRSKYILEKRLKIKIKHFAYPYGGFWDFGRKEIKILRLNNFETGLSTISNNFINKNDNKFIISRVPLSEEFQNPLSNKNNFKKLEIINLLKYFIIKMYMRIF